MNRLILCPLGVRPSFPPNLSQDWINYNQHFNVPARDLKRADDRRGVRFIWRHLDYISESVAKLGAETIDTQAVSYCFARGRFVIVWEQ